ncbi:DUF3592 domain-containing protein [Methanolobus profundi]|uniref:DUF3592 domain-containing protein n=1 Tax=Methanolobus profundi TaxID=487685 RepID=A0A1I4UU96_9EURY|nr:DUF3592 domain-containing protein [Methanolobus profundi]SFM92552.1 hypothetical protein SAMN04488696_2894 [Methanolobus profundi]
MAKEFDYYRIRSIDYTSDFASGATIVPLVSCAFFYFIGFETQFLSWIKIAVFSSLAGILFLAWRRHFFHELYVKGVDVTGRIDSAQAFKRGGSRVEYKYEYQGEKYWRGNTLTASSFRKYGFSEGDEVVLRIDPKNPRRAVIRDIYFLLDVRINQ